MSLFVLDTVGDQDLLSEKHQKNVKPLIKTALAEKTDNLNEVSSDDEDYFGMPGPNVDISEIINEALSNRKQRQQNTKLFESMEKVHKVKNAEPIKWDERRNKSDIDHSDFNMKTGKFDDNKIIAIDLEKELEKSQLNAGFEQKKGIPSLPFNAQKRENRLERSKTKGSKWFNMSAPEVTEEVANDLKVLQMRSVLNPKQFYKKNDLKVLPKYFQVGTVQHSPLDHYSERHIRKNKKKSLVDELLADADVQHYTKRKYNEINQKRNLKRNNKKRK